MSGDLPEFERLPRPHLPDERPGKAYAASHRRFNRWLVFGIPVFAVLAFYTSLVVLTQLDDIFLPGNEIGIGGLAKIPGVDNSKNPDFASPEERINILVLGLDLRRDEPDDMAARTDTVMIMTIDPYSKTAGALSIPRDMWVEIPDGYGGYTSNKINVAYEYGEYLYDDYPGGGAGLIKETIKHNFDIEIDYYAVLNFNNFINLIDELGGIDIVVPEDVYDPQYHDCNTCPFYEVYFPAGEHHMDGEEALAYARVRYSDNDFKRIERQQLVVRAVAKKASNLGTVLSNPLNLYNEYKNSVKTDIGTARVPGLARLFNQIDLDNVPMASLQPPLVSACPATVCGGAAGLLWDEQAVLDLIASIFAPEDLDNPLLIERPVISVKNGTVTPDFGKDFASFLSSRGLASAQIRVDEYFNGMLEDRTAIYDLSGKEQSARQLAEWLQIPSTRIYSANHPGAGQFIDEARTTDVVVVLGADAELPGGSAANSNQTIETAGG